MKIERQAPLLPLDGADMQRGPGERLQLGRLAEDVIARYYREEFGFDVRAQNLRLGPYELDVIVQRGQELRIVEVRSSAQRSFNELSWTLVGKKARTLRKAIREMERRGMLESIESFQVDAALVRWNKGARPSIEIWYDILPGDMGV